MVMVIYFNSTHANLIKSVISKVVFKLRACSCVSTQDVISVSFKGVNNVLKSYTLQIFLTEYEKPFSDLIVQPGITHSFEFLRLSSYETFKHSCVSAVQSKQGRFPPSRRPKRGVCNSVCFHLPWYEASCRGELCVAVGGIRWAEQARAGTGKPRLDGGHLLGVCLGCPQGEERGE